MLNFLKKNSIKNTKGFTLIEILVVIAIIGILSSVVLSSLNSARSRSRDARRKMDLKQLSNASEIKFSSEGVYPTSTGWISVDDPPLVAALVPTYISKIATDPGGNAVVGYQYWSKDYPSMPAYSGCSAVVLSSNRYAFYAKLENPSASDLSTIQDSFDLCVSSNWGMNYKVGN